MSDKRLRDRIPILKDLDFDDPKTKKHFALGCILAVFIILVLAANIASSPRSDKKRSISAVDDAAPAYAGEEDSGDIHDQRRKRELLELPNGEDNDILGSPNMIAAREQQRRERSRNNDLKSLYVRGGNPDEDPLAYMSGESSEKDDHAGETPDAARRRQMAEADRLFGIDRGSGDDSGHTGQSEQTAAPAPQTKRIQRPSVSAAQSSMAPLTELTPEPEPEPEPEQSRDAEEQPEQPKAIRKTGGISSLEYDDSVNGISSLDDADQYVTIDDSRPVRVMFVREQKITSGQRVSLRLLDDIAADGILIPKNTHLSGLCSIGDRLEIRVNNIEINGQILNLGYTAFDNDGNEGLYCPESRAKKNSKQAGNEAISLGQQILSSALGSYAASAVNTGTSIVNGNSGKVTAQVNAGYTFYLLKDDF